jgi:hypothetical protein
MKAVIQINDEVGWPWANSVATGRVIEIIHSRHQIESKGKLITRNGTHKNPAVVIKSNKGAMVLKLAHEIQKISN